MVKEAIGTGETLEAATKAAKEKLGAPEEIEVRIEVLKTPQKKILGLFGGSDAEVKVSYEVADEPVKKERKDKRDRGTRPDVCGMLEGEMISRPSCQWRRHHQKHKDQFHHRQVLLVQR